MKRIFFFLLFALVACSSKEKAVNSESTFPILPMAPMGSQESVQDSIGRTPRSAIEGKVLLAGDVPAPIANVQMGLFKKQGDRWSEISKLSTEQGGLFKFTQKLGPGLYELRITDAKYQGAIIVTLDKDPIRDLVLFVSRK